MRSRVFEVVLVSALVWIHAGAAKAETLERDFQETFAVAQGARLELFHGDGDVSVRSWNRDAIDVEVHYRAELRNVGLTTEPGFEVDFERKGDTILVRGRETGNKGIGFFFSRKRDYTYTVHAPDWVVLDFKGDDGDVDIEGWRAEVELFLDDGDVTLTDYRASGALIEAEDGDVEIDGFEGTLEIRVDDGDVDIRECVSTDLEIRAEDGDVSIDRCSGDFELRADDGRISMTKAHASKLRIRSSDGDVDVELASANDLDCQIDVDDGDVALTLGPGISATYSIETDDGGIRVFSGDGVRSERSSLIGQIGDGEGRIEITTADGDVTLR